MPADQVPSVLRLRVVNDRAALESARASALGFAQTMALSERTAFKLELVIEEMLMNRIEHAYAPGQVGHTTVELRAEPDAVVLTFEDEGLAFDPLQASIDSPPSAPPAPLQQARVGGLGLVLTRKAARQCHYERRGARNYFTVVLDRR